jgi:hypothetical protein
MTLLRLAIEMRRLDLAAYALVHSAAVVLARQQGRRAGKEKEGLGREGSPKGQ